MTAQVQERYTARRGRSLAGTRKLVRFNLRRDRIRIPAWIATMVVLTLAVASSFGDIYTSATERQARAVIIRTPTGKIMSGPGYGLDDYTYGAMLANEMLGFLAIFVALMSVLMVVRHTRNEEETGRAELIRAGVVGRHAHLTAALLVAVITNLLLALSFSVGLGILGVATIDWRGSLTFGAALACVGVVFAAIAAVTSQIFDHGRSASGAAGVAIGAAFVLRAMGDTSDSGLSWLSPISWAQQAKAYVDERLWPLLIALVISAVMISIAYRLSVKRDVGAGLRQPRLGRSRASSVLARPLGFAFKLHRVSLIAWILALFALGAAYGSIAVHVETFVQDNHTLLKFLGERGGETIMDAWLSMIVSLLATFTSIFAIMTVIRLRNEENAGYAESVLTTALRRHHWASSHLVIALLGGTVVLLGSGLGLGLSASTSTGDWSLLPKLLGSVAVYIPAVWFAASLTLALFGILPRITTFAWITVVYGLVVGILGTLLQLPEWLLDLSPYRRVPQLPAAPFELPPLLFLTGLSAALILVGLLGFRRRDLDLV